MPFLVKSFKTEPRNCMQDLMTTRQGKIKFCSNVSEVVGCVCKNASSTLVKSSNKSRIVDLLKSVEAVAHLLFPCRSSLRSRKVCNNSALMHLFVKMSVSTQISQKNEIRCVRAEKTEFVKAEFEAKKEMWTGDVYKYFR